MTGKSLRLGGGGGGGDIRTRLKKYKSLGQDDSTSRVVSENKRAEGMIS